MNYETGLERALTNTHELPEGTEFSLKDLFQGADWAALDTGTRRVLGKVFKNKILHSPDCGIAYIGKSTNNSARYRVSKKIN